MSIKTINGTKPNINPDYIAPATDNFWDKLNAAAAFTVGGSVINNIAPNDYQIQNVDYVLSNLPDREQDENFFDDRWNRKKRGLIADIIPSINEYRKQNNLEELNYKAYRYLTDSDTVSEFEKRYNELDKLAFANRTMARNPASVLGLTVGLSMVEPWNLFAGPYALVGQATAGKAALRAGAATAAIAATEEAILYRNDPHRTPGMSLLNIGAAGVIGSTIGGIVGARKSNQKALIKDISARMKSIDDEQHVVLDVDNFYTGSSPDTINLNLASFEDILEATKNIPGVGKKTAQLIVKLRNSKPNKVFDSYADLLDDPDLTKAQKKQLEIALGHCTSPCRFHVNGMPYGGDEATIIGSYGLDKVAAITSPLARLLQSEFPEIRKEAVSLLNTPFMLSDNLQGIATKKSLEEIIDGNRIHYTKLIDSLENNYFNYLNIKTAPNGSVRKHISKNRAGRILRTPANVVRNGLRGNFSKMGTPAGKMSFEEFKLAAVKHRTGAVVSLDKNIIAASKSIDDLFDSNADAVKNLMKSIYKGKEFTWIDSEPYTHRLWNKAVIASDKEGFISFLHEQLIKKYGSKEAAEEAIGDGMQQIDASFRRSVDKIIMSPEERIDLSNIFEPLKRGATHNRFWNFVDDSDLYNTDWAVHDIEAIANSYIMGPLADVSFYNAYKTLNPETVTLRIRKAAIDNARMKYRQEGIQLDDDVVLFEKHTESLDNSLSLLESMLKRVRGSYVDVWSPVPGGTIQGVLDNIKRYNNIRLGGAFGLRSAADVGRTVMFLGLKKAYGPLFESYIKRNRKAMMMYDQASAELAAINVGNEINSMSLVSAITNTNFNTPYSDKFTQLMSKANSSMFVFNGLVLWNQSMKRNAGIGVMNEIITSAKAATLGKLDSKKAANLAKLGLEREDLYEIAKEFKAHGASYRGVHLMNFDNLNADSTIADKLARAVKKEVDTIIVTPGIGDTPLLMENSFVSMMMQYRSFPMAAMLRQTIPLAQNMNRNALSGLLISVVTGMAARQYINFANDKDGPDDLDELLYQGLDDTGTLSTIGEFANYGQMIYNRNPFFLGPTVTGAGDMYKVGSSLISGEEMNQYEINAASRLVPYDGLKKLVTAIVPEIGE